MPFSFLFAEVRTARVHAPLALCASLPPSPNFLVLLLLQITATATATATNTTYYYYYFLLTVLSNRDKKHYPLLQATTVTTCLLRYSPLIEVYTLLLLRLRLQCWLFFIDQHCNWPPFIHSDSHPDEGCCSSPLQHIPLILWGRLLSTTTTLNLSSTECNSLWNIYLLR